MTLLEVVFFKVQENVTIKKYNQLYSIDLLNMMRFDDSFKWSKYYWHISQIANNLNEEAEKTMYAVELLGLSARLLDDFLDKDTSLSNTISLEHLSLLSIELLVESLELIGHNDYFDYSLLKGALHSEFTDYSTKLNTHSTLDFYFEEIVLKSTAIFRLVTKLASAESLPFNQFTTHYGILSQIKNDISGIFDEQFTDIIQQKNTLPIITSVNTINSEHNAYLLTLFSNPGPSKKRIQAKITQSGALNFCMELISSEKRKALSILNQFPETKDLLELKEYLRLEI